MKKPFLVFLVKDARATTTPEHLIHAGLSRADARYALASRFPSAVALCNGREEALQRVRQLRAARAEAFAISQEALNAFSPRLVRTGERKQDGILWRDQGFSSHLRSADVRMILHGRFNQEKEVRSRMSHSGQTYIYTGIQGIGRMCALPAREDKSIRRTTESFLCLIRSRHEALLLTGNAFRFASLVPARTPTRKERLLKLISLLRETYPRALFDDSLYRYPMKPALYGSRKKGTGPLVTTTTREGSTVDRATSICLLLYLQAFGNSA
jgi:hypothetical protein